MSELNHPFAATGILRDFTGPGAAPDGTARFLLQVGNLSIPCCMHFAAGTPPRDGQRMHVIGAWILEADETLCVEVHAMYPAPEMRADEPRLSPPSASTS